MSYSLMEVDVPPRKITPGSTLAGNVCDPKGRVLMRAGQRLGKREIKALKAWGINPPVLESSGRETRQVSADPALQAWLDARFSLSNREHPAIAALYRICLRRAAGGSVPPGQGT